MVVVLKYTVLRIAFFVASLAVVAALGARGLLALVLAAGISVALSYVLLRRQREAVTEAVARRVGDRMAEQDRARMQAAAIRETTPGDELDLGAPTPAHGISLGKQPGSR